MKRSTLATRIARWRIAADAVRHDADDLTELADSFDEAAGFAVARPELRHLVAVLRASADSLADAVDRAEVLRSGALAKMG